MQKKKESKSGIVRYLEHIFIDGLSGMAMGLFATLIVGTILSQIGLLIPGTVGNFVRVIASLCKVLTGAGIGAGVASKFKRAPLVIVSCAVIHLMAETAGLKEEVLAVRQITSHAHVRMSA